MEVVESQMLMTVGYGIMGKPELRAELAKYENSEDFFEIIGAPQLWTIETGGFSKYLPHIVEPVKIKLMFLAYLNYDYLIETDPNNELANAVRSVLGEPPHSIETFDKWWELITFEEYESVERIQDELTVDALKRLQKSGISPVDDLIDRLIAKKMAGK
jgi:hypothetical protein